MALQRDCAVCGGRFTAKRDSARYCSARCRQRAKRAPAPAPERAEAAPIITLAPPPPARAAPSTDEGITAATERVLDEADRRDTPDGQAALYLARALEAGGVGQTGSSIASLIREHRTALAKAIDGANVAETPLERVRRQRDQRKAGA